MSAGNLKSGIDGGLMGGRFFTAMMEMRMVAAFLVVLMVITAGLLGPSQGLAAMETYEIDAEHTAIRFTIRHFFSKVPGQFAKFEGTIILDEADLSKGSVNFTLDTSSIDTNEPARDKHLRSDAFFDAENHPKITFQSTAVRQEGPDKLQVDGNLTIRGITKSVTLEVDVLGFGNLYTLRRAAFEARVRINRHDFNVSWNDVVEGGGLILGSDVDILINLEAKQRPQLTVE